MSGTRTRRTAQGTKGRRVQKIMEIAEDHDEGSGILEPETLELGGVMVGDTIAAGVDVSPIWLSRAWGLVGRFVDEATTNDGEQGIVAMLARVAGGLGLTRAAAAFAAHEAVWSEWSSIAHELRAAVAVEVGPEATAAYWLLAAYVGKSHEALEIDGDRYRIGCAIGAILYAAIELEVQRRDAVRVDDVDGRTAGAIAADAVLPDRAVLAKFLVLVALELSCEGATAEAARGLLQWLEEPSPEVEWTGAECVQVTEYAIAKCAGLAAWCLSGTTMVKMSEPVCPPCLGGPSPAAPVVPRLEVVDEAPLEGNGGAS